MKIGILHLTDLHIENDILEDRIDLLEKAINYDLKNISNLYIVISGDLTNYGRETEFKNGIRFIDVLVNKIKPEKQILNIKLIIVPGNHDCCFDNVKKTRKIILEECRVDILEEDDFYTEAMAVQENFWNFYKAQINEDIAFEVSYKINFTPKLDFKISFHCYNTSWLTEINEKQGSLVIPENKFIENNSGEYVVSVFHHPIDWLSANTTKNNKQRFEEHLISNSNLVIYGHEHDKGNPKNIIQKKNNVVFCGGKAFNMREKKKTGFSYYEIDSNNKSINVKTFLYKEKLYEIENEETFEIEKKNKRNYSLNNDFNKLIENLKIPLKHHKKERLTLSDIYVYPDLEPLVDDDKTVQYPNSFELINKVKNSETLNVFIEGADQSGKTSLFYTFFKSLYKLGYTPLFLRGKNCNETNIKKLVKKALKEQYGSENVNLYFQTSKKILLLDNLHKSKLNSVYKKKLINSLNDKFDYVFINSDNTYNTGTVTEETTNFKEFEKYKLLPLGHEKRSELIEKWLLIGENKLTIKEEILFEKLKGRFAQIDSLIGNKLMPSYPIFILTLLQGLDENLQDFTQTSYANIYLVLIKAGLIKEGIKDNILTGILNILKELAFFLYEKDKESFNLKIFEEFINEYSQTFFKHKSLTNDRILKSLTNSNILKYDDEYYNFSYKYIFYFLVAQKIAANIDEYEDLVYELCDNIHLEINANILIFLSHHTKAQVLIDNIALSSQIPFEKQNQYLLMKTMNLLNL